MSTRPDPFHRLPVAFEERWRAASKPMRSGVELLINDLLESERQTKTRQRKRKPADDGKFRLVVETLLCNLHALALADGGAMLAVRRDTHASKESSVFGKAFNDALDLAQTLGLVEQRKGYRYSESDTGAPSTVRATSRLDGYLPMFPLARPTACRARAVAATRARRTRNEAGGQL